MEWTDESITRLRSLWHEGLSTAEIGRRMQITKNAVVGKAHRLTLPARPSPIRKSLELASTGLQAQRSTLAEGSPLGQRPRGAPGLAVAFSKAEPVPAPVVPVPAINNVQPLRPIATADADPARSQTASVRPFPTASATGEGSPAPALRAVIAPRRRGLTCCWPLGEPGTKEFRFCGGEPTAGKPYCTEHAALAYVKLRDRRDSVA